VTNASYVFRVRGVNSRAASRNSGVPPDPFTPRGGKSRILSRQGKCHRKRSRTSARAFGSTVRPTALLLTELSPQVNGSGPGEWQGCVC
jgi:hypothetical protein